MIVVFILFILTIYYYIQDRKAEVLFCLTAITNSCFFFINADNLPVKPTDFALVFILTISLFNIPQKKYYSIVDDSIGKIIFIILIYFTLNFLATVILRLDNPVNALKVIRPYYALLLYFYVRKMQKKDFSLYLNLMLVASIIQGLFYYLQIIGIDGILTGRVEEAEGSGGLTRFANFPKMASFFVLYFIIKDRISMHKKGFFIAFFGMMLILGQMRGVVIALSCTIGLFFFLKRKTKYVGYIAVGLIAYQFVIAPMFEYRERNATHSTSEEIIMILKNPTGVFQNYTEGDEKGTFSFRIAMLFERIYYMMDNPQYAPFGVGCIHEESPNNIWTFYVCTYNESLVKGYSMLASADIAWVGLLMRFGIVGILLWCMLFYYWGRNGIPLVKRSNDTIFMAASVMVLSDFLVSFDSDNLGRISSIISLIFYFSVIYEYKNRANNSNCNKYHQSVS